MKCSIQRGEAELKGTFYLSPNENICSIEHSLFVLYTLRKMNFMLSLCYSKNVC